MLSGGLASLQMGERRIPDGWVLLLSAGFGSTERRLEAKTEFRAVRFRDQQNGLMWWSQFLNGITPLVGGNVSIARRVVRGTRFSDL